MATKKQTAAARRNVKKAIAGAKRMRTIANLPKRTRRDLAKQAATGRRRGGAAGGAPSRIATGSSSTTSRAGWTSRGARAWASGS